MDREFPPPRLKQEFPDRKAAITLCRLFEASRGKDLIFQRNTGGKQAILRCIGWDGINRSTINGGGRKKNNSGNNREDVILLPMEDGAGGGEGGGGGGGSIEELLQSQREQNQQHQHQPTTTNSNNNCNVFYNIRKTRAKGKSHWFIESCFSQHSANCSGNLRLKVADIACDRVLLEKLERQPQMRTREIAKIFPEINLASYKACRIRQKAQGQLEEWGQLSFRQLPALLFRSCFLNPPLSSYFLFLKGNERPCIFSSEICRDIGEISPFIENLLQERTTTTATTTFSSCISIPNFVHCLKQILLDVFDIKTVEMHHSSVEIVLSGWIPAGATAFSLSFRPDGSPIVVNEEEEESEKSDEEDDDDDDEDRRDFHLGKIFYKVPLVTCVAAGENVDAYLNFLKIVKEKLPWIFSSCAAEVTDTENSKSNGEVPKTTLIIHRDEGLMDAIAQVIPNQPLFFSFSFLEKQIERRCGIRVEQQLLKVVVKAITKPQFDAAMETLRARYTSTFALSVLTAAAAAAAAVAAAATMYRENSSTNNSNDDNARSNQPDDDTGRGISLFDLLEKEFKVENWSIYAAAEFGKRRLWGGVGIFDDDDGKKDGKWWLRRNEEEEEEEEEREEGINQSSSRVRIQEREEELSDDETQGHSTHDDDNNNEHEVVGPSTTTTMLSAPFLDLNDGVKMACLHAMTPLRFFQEWPVVVSSSLQYLLVRLEQSKMLQSHEKQLNDNNNISPSSSRGGILEALFRNMKKKSKKVCKDYHVVPMQVEGEVEENSKHQKGNSNNVYFNVVREGRERNFIVNLQDKICSCGEWFQFAHPCIHGWLVLESLQDKSEDAFASSFAPQYFEATIVDALRKISHTPAMLQYDDPQVDICPPDGFSSHLRTKRRRRIRNEEENEENIAAIRSSSREESEGRGRKRPNNNNNSNEVGNDVSENEGATNATSSSTLATNLSNSFNLSHSMVPQPPSSSNNNSNNNSNKNNNAEVMSAAAIGAAMALRRLEHNRTSSTSAAAAAAATGGGEEILLSSSHEDPQGENSRKKRSWNQKNPRKPILCSLCGQMGHNKRGCGKFQSKAKRREKIHHTRQEQQQQAQQQQQQQQLQQQQSQGEQQQQQEEEQQQ